MGKPFYVCLNCFNQSYSLTSVFPCLHRLDGLTYNTPSTHRPQPAARVAHRTSPQHYSRTAQSQEAAWHTLSETDQQGLAEGGAPQVMFCSKLVFLRPDALPATNPLNDVSSGRTAESSFMS